MQMVLLHRLITLNSSVIQDRVEEVLRIQGELNRFLHLKFLWTKKHNH